MKKGTKILATLIFGALVAIISISMLNGQRALKGSPVPSPAVTSAGEKHENKEYSKDPLKKDLTLDNYSELLGSLNCESMDILHGNPTYWDSAAGINCYLNERGSILVRIFEQESTLKTIGDWDEVVTLGNQLIYSENWFATGPPENLREVFKEYNYIDIASEIPSPQEMSDDEFSVSMCSSIIYNIIQESLAEGYSEEKYSDYYKYYPQDVVEEVYQQVSREGAFDSDKGKDWYETLGKISVHDKKIKELCRENPW